MRENECKRCCCFIYRARAIYTQLKDQFREAACGPKPRLLSIYCWCTKPMQKHTHTLAVAASTIAPAFVFVFFFLNTCIQFSKNTRKCLHYIQLCVSWRGHGRMTECSSWRTAGFNMQGDQYSEPAPIDCNSSSFFLFFNFILTHSHSTLSCRCCLPRQYINKHKHTNTHICIHVRTQTHTWVAGTILPSMQTKVQ